MSKTKTIDLTSGPILKTLAELALPIMASSLLGTAYNITDMAWIGMLGSKAVAGVGVGGMYVWLSQGLVALPRMGGQVNVAQACGRGDYEQARGYAASALRLTFLLGILFAAVCIVFIHPLLGFFNLGDAETYTAAKLYTLITCGLILFSFLNLTLTGLSTAQGDSKTPLMANLLGLVGNMILVLIVMLIRIMHSDLEPNILQNTHVLSRFPAKYYISIFKIGFPTAVQSSIYCMISMILTRMVSAFGAGAIATQRVGGQIESVSWNTADGFAAALNAFVGQNYGAKKPDRIRKGYNISFKILAVWGLIVTGAFVFLPGPIASLFFHEKDVLAIAINYLIIIGFSETFMTIELMTIGALSGLGMTKLCSIISIVLTSARIPLAMILTQTSLGLNGVWWALTITSITKGIVFYFTFHHTSRHLPDANDN